MSHIRIAYACNDGYVMQTGVSIISLFENNRHVDSITLYLISCGISQNNITLIKHICETYGRSFVKIEFKDIAYDLNISSVGRHLETIYAKIFFERIESVERMLYIDSDTIVTASIEELWNTNLNECFMGMVKTYTGIEAKTQLRIPGNSSFFNDGVALVNVQYCRQHNLISLCKAEIARYNGNPPVLSEGVLNKVCLNHICSLSPRYNMMAGLYQLIDKDIKYVNGILGYEINELRSSYENPVIIHFLSGFYNRPWSKYCTHPLRHFFYKYKELSPWKDIPLTEQKLPFRIRLIGLLMNWFGPRGVRFLRGFI